MELVKLDISKAGVEISADMKNRRWSQRPASTSGNGAGQRTSWDLGDTSPRRSPRPTSPPSRPKPPSCAPRRLIICIGIGGSYLGAKAVLEAMSNPFKLLHREQKQPTVVFAGQNISEDYIHELLEASKEHSIAAIVISKSGTTTEPAIAFRLIKPRSRSATASRRPPSASWPSRTRLAAHSKTLATQEGYPEPSSLPDNRRPDASRC